MTIKKITPFPVLSTDRLILREVRLLDAPEVLAMRSHPINLQYTGRAPAKSIEDAEAHINKVLQGQQELNWINWTITIPEEDKAMGFIGFWNHHETLPETYVGYELHPNFHGKGYMTEAAQAVFDFGFLHMGIENIKAHLHQANEKSLNVLRRFNFSLSNDLPDEQDPEMVLWSLNKKEHRYTKL